MRFFTKSAFLLVVLAALLCAPALYADPVPGSLQIRLFDGTNTVTVTDQVAPDANPVLGAVTFIGSIGTWTVNVTTGTGFPVQQPQGHLDLSSLNVNTGGAGQLDVLVTQVGFVGPNQGATLSFGGTLSGAAGSTVQATAWAGADNNPFTQNAGLIGTVGPFGLGAFSGTVSGSGSAAANPYASTIRIRINATGGVSFSGDAELTPVPEPTTVVLLGTGLAGIALWARRRKSTPTE